MTSSDLIKNRAIAPLPPALSSMWRLCKLGYRHEPRLMACGVRAVAARRAARCAPRVVADAARQRRPRAPARHGARRGDRPRRVDRRDLVSPHRQHARAAPLPRQGDHRARVARRATAGIGRDHRASGTPGVSRSPVHAPQSGVRARPHVHVAVFHARVDPAAGRDDGAAGVDSPGAPPARRVRGPDRVDIDVAARGRASRAGAWRAGQPAGASPVHHRHDRAARKGSARHRHRRAPRHASAARRGSAGTGRWRPPAGARRCGTRWRGRSSARLCRRGRVRVVRPRRAGQQRAAGAGRGRAAVGVHRRHRRRDRIPARILDGRLAAARLARGLRRLRRRRRAICRLPPCCVAASGSITCRSPIPARRALCWTMCR